MDHVAPIPTGGIIISGIAKIQPVINAGGEYIFIPANGIVMNGIAVTERSTAFYEYIVDVTILKFGGRGIFTHVYTYRTDTEYASGIIRSAEDITEIIGAQTFSGEDTRGYYRYNLKLNRFSNKRVRLLYSDQPQYDYIVDGTGGLAVRYSWINDIQTEIHWDIIAIDTDVEVSSDNTNWTKMHFAEYDPTSPDGNFYYVWVDGRTSWSSIGGTEVFEITMVAASGLNSKYLLMYSTTSTSYYVWFNVDSAGVDPAGPGGALEGLGYTQVEVTLNGTDTAEMVATKTKVVINGLAEFLAIISPNDSKVVAVATSTSGDVYDAQPGNSGLTIEVKMQGGDKENYQYARLV